MKRLQILKLQYLVPEAAIQLFSCLTICKKFIVCLVTVVNRVILVWGVMAEHGIVGRRTFGSFIARFMPTYCKANHALTSAPHWVQGRN